MSEEIEELEEDSTEEIGGERKRPKPARTRASSSFFSTRPTERLSLELDSSDDESQQEDPEVYTLTAYILVEKNIPQPQRGSRPQKIPEAEKYMQRGPIDFKSTDRYSSFLVKISQALPCPVLNIVEEKLTWKPQTPKNATALLLGGETGFSAMVRSFRNAKKACMVMVMMPPPTRPTNEKPVCPHAS